MQLYGHANYADKKVTEGFYFPDPNTRHNIYSLDSGQTLLIGDVLAARARGYPGDDRNVGHVSSELRSEAAWCEHPRQRRLSRHVVGDPHGEHLAVPRPIC